MPLATGSPKREQTVWLSDPAFIVLFMDAQLVIKIYSKSSYASLNVDLG